MYPIKVDVVLHSRFEGHPDLITLALTYPRMIHAELMTHRCLVGETELYFDLPSGSKGSPYRLHKMSINEFYDKWVNGSSGRVSSQYVERDLSNINPFQFYTAKQLAKLAGYSSASNIRSECRKGNIRVENPDKKRSEDFVISGKNFIEWNTSPATYRQDIRHRLEQMQIRAFDVASGEVIHTSITDIWKVGDKPTFTLKAGEYSITGTDDHPILTKEGWKELGALTPDDFIVTVSNKQNEKTDPIAHKKVNGIWRSSWQNRMSAKLSGEQENCCKYCDKEAKLEIHHIIPVHEDPSKCFDEDNIVAICNECHKLEHETRGWQEGNPLNGYYQKVDSVTSTGKTETVYDLSVADLNHNFVANGIVVHNCFSRNASSSRAIPVQKMLQMIKESPAEPLYWGTNKAGMQAGEELEGWRLAAAKFIWSTAAKTACFFSSLLNRVGLHKQHSNRGTEPYQYITVLVTATEWDNFFELRDHPDAQPEIRFLAQLMRRTIEESKPQILRQGEWHLPYILKEEFGVHPLRVLQEVSAARCARVSYLTHAGKTPEVATDLVLFDRLAGSRPIHASPLEHVAVPSWKENANFRGWKQFRKVVEEEIYS